MLLFPDDLTNNPQRMWDPEKGYVMGQDVRQWTYKNITMKNQTAQFGTTAYLHCRVKNIADKKVS